VVTSDLHGFRLVFFLTSGWPMCSTIEQLEDQPSAHTYQATVLMTAGSTEHGADFSDIQYGDIVSAMFQYTVPSRIAEYSVRERVFSLGDDIM